MASTFDGADEVARMLAGEAANVDRRVAGALAAEAKVLEDDMRRSARRGPTGRMRGSVVADAVDPLEWEVGDTDWAAHIEEFGSVKQAPHPFVFPAGDRAERRVGSIIQHVGRG